MRICHRCGHPMRPDEEHSEPGLSVWVCNRTRDVRQPDGSIKTEPFPCRNKKGEFTRAWDVKKDYDNKGKIKVGYIPMDEYIRSADRNNTGKQETEE